MLVEREVSDQPVQSAVFFLQLQEAPQLVHVQMRILLLLGGERSVTHSELPAEVADRGAGFSLSDGIHDLFFGER